MTRARTTDAASVTMNAFEGAALRAELLPQLAIEVGEAADARAAARAVVRLGRALLDGISSVLWLADGEGGLDLVASEGVPESFLVQWKRVLPTDDAPAMHAVLRGEPIWVGSVDDYEEVSPAIAARAREANRPMAFAALPLQFEGRTLGVLVFGFTSPHPFTVAEKSMALAVASQAAHALERARLQSAQARAVAGLRLIMRAGEMVGASLDVDTTLTALARAVVPDLADWCAVDLFAEGNVRRLTAYHADPAKVALAEEYARRFPSRLDDPASSHARIIATKEPLWTRRITPEMLTGAISNPDQLSILLSLGLRSTVQVPLLSDGTVGGVVTFIMSDSGREYDETDRDLLVELGRRASYALTNASLYAREQRARDRITRIAAVTAELARARTSAEVGKVACREGAAALDASTAALYAVDGDRLRRIADFGYPDEHRSAHGEIALAMDLPVTRVVRDSAPVTIESAEDFVREYPALDGSAMLASAPAAFMCTPLVGGEGRVAGVLAFGFRGARAFSHDDRAFAQTIADHCAHAFDRARILDLERSTNERLALLAAAGETFSATVDYEATLAAVVHIALPTLGDFGFFDVVEEEGNVRRVSHAHEDPDVAAILAQSKWVRSERTDINLCALSTGESALHPRIDGAFLRDMATSEGHLAVLKALKLCSMITVPVILRGAVVGALTLCHGRSGRHHTNDDLELARELARRGAIAVEQARLYRASREAAERAEAANRVKDDFLATVSHELRTPLNAILGWAHMLDGTRMSDPAYVQRGLDVIRRNAHAQREIVADILDVSRIIGGNLQISVAPVDLASIVRDGVETVRPAATTKGLRVDAEGVGDEVVVAGDAARLRQVVSNLLSNAVKFTNEGGHVRAELRVVADSVVLRVVDDGIGIRPDILPFVFDRFRQGDSSSTRAHGGLGLGLSIVRYLVELHRGTVTGSSAGEGRGATFEVVLPRPRGGSAPGFMLDSA